MKAFSALGLFLGATLLFTYPLSRHPGSEALDLGPDTRLFLWTLGWDVSSFTHHPISIFDANIFYPERSTLAYSEHQIGSALFAAPFLWSTGNLVLAMNAVALLSCLLSGAFAFYLARQVGLGRMAASLAGLVFLLTPPRFYRLGQLHLVTVQWIPLCLGLLHRYARGGSRRHLLLAALAFTLQALSGGQSALFLVIAASGLLVYLAALGELRPRGSLARDAVLAAALAAALNLPFVLPYLRVQRELGLERSLDEARVWSPNLASFLASPTHVDRFLVRSLGLERWVDREAKAFLFPGLVPLVLFALAFVPRRERDLPNGPGAERAPPDGVAVGLKLLDGGAVLAALLAIAIQASGGLRFTLGGLRLSASSFSRAAVIALLLVVVRLACYRFRPFAFASALSAARRRLHLFVERNFGVEAGYYVFLCALSLWASWGPGAGLYAALYRLVPGFDFLRVPSRFTILAVLALSILSGVGAEKLRRLVPKHSTAAIPLVFGLLLTELAAFPLPTVPYSVELSPMDRFLAGQAERAPLAAFPIPDPRDTIAAASRHSYYMLQSTAHYLPLVNGYSGFTPPSHDRLFRTLATFPTDEGLDALDALGVRHLVFYRNGYGEEPWRTLKEKLGGYGERLRIEAAFDEGEVYALVPVGPSGLTPDRRGRESSGVSRSRTSSDRPGSVR